jgi:restriction endonuclease S subunit
MSRQHSGATKPLASVTLSISSGKTTRRDHNGRNPLYGSTGPIGRTNRSEFTGPSILVARVGANAGSVYSVDGSYGVTDNTLVIRPKSGQNVSFLTDVLRYADLNHMVYGSGQPLVTGTMLKQLEIPDLQPADQRRIAGALDDASALIVNLERLIAKKQAMKQAMMQQLLTGRTRLAGHRSKWIDRRLGSVLGKLEAGVSVNSIPHLGRRAVLKTSCVSGGSFYPYECKTVAPSDIARVKVNPRADSLIISRMNTPALVGEVGYVAQDWPNLFLPDRLWLATKSQPGSVDMSWLSYALCFSENAARLKELATGTSGSMKNIAKGSLLNLSLLHPPLEEQEAIACVLSDLDRDLATMQRYLSKTQVVKQGMMQELLTGRTRLPVAEAVA